MHDKVKIEDGIRKQEDEQFAQEHAEDARWEMACATKFYIPGYPDPERLCALAWEYRRTQRGRKRIIRRTRRTWPTLRELKLATAIDERIIKKIIKSLRPMKGEIIKAVRNKFSKRGAIPLRYGPRLIVGVLKEFVDRLPEFPIDDRGKKRLQRTTLLVKRAFAARLGCSRSST
jgi:hypothetical protein